MGACREEAARPDRSIHSNFADPVRTCEQGSTGQAFQFESGRFAATDFHA